MIPALLLTLIPKALRLLAPKMMPGAESILKSAANVLEDKKEDPELLKALAALDIEAMKVEAGILASDDDVAKAEIASEHWFVWAARPFLLYCAGIGTLAMIATLMAHVDIPVGPLADLMLPLWGHAGFYTYQRTREKISNAA